MRAAPRADLTNGCAVRIAKFRGLHTPSLVPESIPRKRFHGHRVPIECTYRRKRRKAPFKNELVPPSCANRLIPRRPIPADSRARHYRGIADPVFLTGSCKSRGHAIERSSSRNPETSSLFPCAGFICYPRIAAAGFDKDVPEKIPLQSV